MKRPDRETLVKATHAAHGIAGCFQEALHTETRARSIAEDAKTAANIGQPDVHRLARSAEAQLEYADNYYAQGVACLEHLAALLGKKVVDK